MIYDCCYGLISVNEMIWCGESKVYLLAMHLCAIVIEVLVFDCCRYRTATQAYVAQGFRVSVPTAFFLGTYSLHTALTCFGTKAKTHAEHEKGRPRTACNFRQQSLNKPCRFPREQLGLAVKSGFVTKTDC